MLAQLDAHALAALDHGRRWRRAGDLAVDLVLDARAQLADTAPKAPYTCKDADDQQFIDLAVAHTAVLLSKDKAVLCMAKRLATLGVSVNRQWAPAAIQPQPITP